jgi:protein arginine N-methyltransferase 3
MKYPWQDDKYLTPFCENDPLLYGFELDIDDDGTETKLLSNKEIVAMLDNKEVQSFMSMMGPENSMEDLAVCLKDEMKGLAIDNLHSNDVIVDEIRNGSFTSLKDHMNSEAKLVSSLKVNDVMVTKKNQKENRRVSFAQVAARERYSINQTYFGSYSTFGIHREMLSDKVCQVLN